MKIKTYQQLIDEASKQIKTITPDEIRDYRDVDTILIDIRDIRELWRDGTIKNSKHIPRCFLEFWLDPASPYFKEEFSISYKKILFCAQGMRSALAVKSLQDMGFTNVTHVKGGFAALKDYGFQIEEVKKK